LTCKWQEWDLYSFPMVATMVLWLGAPISFLLIFFCEWGSQPLKKCSYLKERDYSWFIIIDNPRY